MSSSSRDTPMVTAIIAAHNEADVVGWVVRDLVQQGIRVHFLDDGSTDGTVAEVERFMTTGLVHVEHFPQESGVDPAAAAERPWENILRRKQQLALELDGDWFIHHDADEFRESPWQHLGLLEGIHRVDEAGYNAIDFELLDFQPTHDDFRPGDDVRESFPYYEPGRSWNKIQVRCWKRGPGPLDLASTGGHDAVFPGRTVFPIRFLLRHYPIRGQAHGERKVFDERRPRFVAAERHKGWHRQYDDVTPGYGFIRDPATLRRFEPEAVRLQLVLRNRDLEEARKEPDGLRATLAEEHRRATEQLNRELDERNRELIAAHQELDARNHELIRLRHHIEERNRELDERNHELIAAHQELDARNHELIRLRHDIEERNRELDERNHELIDARRMIDQQSQRLAQEHRDRSEAQRQCERLAEGSAHLQDELRSVYASRSWRWTAPVRRVLALLQGLPRHSKD